MRALPDEILQLLLELFDDVEKQGSWPTGIAEALVIPSDSSHSQKVLIDVVGKMIKSVDTWREISTDTDGDVTKMVMKKREVLMERGRAALRGRIWLSWGGWPEYTPEE